MYTVGWTVQLSTRYLWVIHPFYLLWRPISSPISLTSRGHPSAWRAQTPTSGLRYAEAHHVRWPESWEIRYHLILNVWSTLLILRCPDVITWLEGFRPLFPICKYLCATHCSEIFRPRGPRNWGRCPHAPPEAGIKLMAGTLSVPKKSFAALSLKISGGCKGIKIAILLWTSVLPAQPLPLVKQGIGCWYPLICSARLVLDPLTPPFHPLC